VSLFEDRSVDTDETPAVRRLRLTPASKIPPKPTRWTWQARIPAGAVTLIPGREGIGKSLLLTWLTASLTRGTLPGVHHGQAKPVFYAATEDSWARTIVPRLIAAGADLDVVYRVEVEEEGGIIMPLTLPVDCLALEADIARVGAAMLALDPLMSAIGAGIDTHKDRELRLALEPLAHVADVTGCAVVSLAHFNKSSSTDVLNLVTGSRAFTTVLRAVIAVARDPDSEDGACVLSQAKNNLGRLDLPNLGYLVDSVLVPTDEGDADVGRLRFTGEVDRSVSDILGDHGDREERSERDEAAEWLRGYLEAHDGEATRADILVAAKLEGITERTLGRARVKAKVTAKRAGFGQPAIWRLPSVTPQSCRSGQDTDGGRTGTTDGTTDADALLNLEPEWARTIPRGSRDEPVHRHRRTRPRAPGRPDARRRWWHARQGGTRARPGAPGGRPGAACRPRPDRRPLRPPGRAGAGATTRPGAGPAERASPHLVAAGMRLRRDQGRLPL
jgi:hypothetical protein